MIYFPNDEADNGEVIVAELVAEISWEQVLVHLETLYGLTILLTETDGLTEQWIDFRYRGCSFSLHQTLGNHLFFAKREANWEVIGIIRGYLLLLERDRSRQLK